jgi:penicillin-binding protein 1A
MEMRLNRAWTAVALITFIPFLGILLSLIAHVASINKQLSSSLSSIDLRSQLERFRQTPSIIPKTVVAVEAPGFYEEGDYLLAWLHAGWKAIYLHEMTSASLCDRVARSLAFNLHERAISWHFNNIIRAELIQWHLSKEELLAYYLDTVCLGKRGSKPNYGVAEGAASYFGKTVADLNPAEIAMLVGLIRDPDYYSPDSHIDRALEKQRMVLSKMRESGILSNEQLQTAIKYKLHFTAVNKGVNAKPEKK